MSVMKHHHTNQHGASLLVTLVILLIITIIGVQISTQGNVNQVLVQNENARLITKQHAQNIANVVMSDVKHFLNPETIQIRNETGTALSSHPDTGRPKVPDTLENGSYVVTYTDPTCTEQSPVPGYSLTAQIVPNVYHWTFNVTVTDTVTGAFTSLDVGTKFNFTADNCI